LELFRLVKFVKYLLNVLYKLTTEFDVRKLPIGLFFVRMLARHLQKGRRRVYTTSKITSQMWNSLQSK